MLAYPIVDAGSASAGCAPVEKNWAAAHAPTPTTASRATPPPISRPRLRPLPPPLVASGDPGGRGAPPPASRYSGAPVAGWPYAGWPDAGCPDDGWPIGWVGVGS